MGMKIVRVRMTVKGMKTARLCTVDKMGWFGGRWFSEHAAAYVSGVAGQSQTGQAGRCQLTTILQLPSGPASQLSSRFICKLYRSEGSSWDEHPVGLSVHACGVQCLLSCPYQPP